MGGAPVGGRHPRTTRPSARPRPAGMAEVDQGEVVPLPGRQNLLEGGHELAGVLAACAGVSPPVKMSNSGRTDQVLPALARGGQIGER